VELNNISSLAVTSIDSGGLDDRDGTVSSTVSTSHFLVHLFYSAVESGISVLLVGVVHTGTGVVSNPNSIVLNGGWVLLENLVNSKNLTVGLLHTAKLSQKVPELGLGLNLVPSPHLHSVNLWVWILLSWDVTSNNLELTVQELQTENKLSGDVQDVSTKRHPCNFDAQHVDLYDKIRFSCYSRDAIAFKSMSNTQAAEATRLELPSSIRTYGDSVSHLSTFCFVQ
jgi:hypothetical protein